MLLTTVQAQSALHEAAIKESKWLSGVGCRYRVFKVPGTLDIETLPNDFEVMWIEANGDAVVCQWDLEE